MILLIRSLEPNRIGGAPNSSPAVFFLVFKPSSSVFSRSSSSSNRTEDLSVEVIFLWFDSILNGFLQLSHFSWQAFDLSDQCIMMTVDQCIMISALWWPSMTSLIVVSLSLPFSCSASGQPLSFSTFARFILQTVYCCLLKQTSRNCRLSLNLSLSHIHQYPSR